MLAKSLLKWTHARRAFESKGLILPYKQEWKAAYLAYRGSRPMPGSETVDLHMAPKRADFYTQSRKI